VGVNGNDNVKAAEEKRGLKGFYTFWHYMPIVSVILVKIL
jgi:hypothetical protein